MEHLSQGYRLTPGHTGFYRVQKPPRGVPIGWVVKASLMGGGKGWIAYRAMGGHRTARRIGVFPAPQLAYEAIMATI